MTIVTFLPCYASSAFSLLYELIFKHKSDGLLCNFEILISFELFSKCKGKYHHFLLFFHVMIPLPFEFWRMDDYCPYNALFNSLLNSSRLLHNLMDEISSCVWCSILNQILQLIGKSLCSSWGGFLVLLKCKVVLLFLFQGGLQSLLQSIEDQDPDKVSVGLASSLDTVAQLELLQVLQLSLGSISF